MAGKFAIVTGAGSGVPGGEGSELFLEAQEITRGMLELCENPEHGDGTILEVNKGATRVVPLYLAESPSGVSAVLPRLAENTEKIWNKLGSEGLKAKAYSIFFDFIHDLRAHDPKGRGLQHLVTEEDDYRVPAHDTSPKRTFVEGRALEAFRATAAKDLQSLWFKCTPRGARALSVLDWMRAHVFNYGVPVFPSFTFFEPPLPDPRDGISRDLQKIGGSGCDPREAPLGWRMLLRDVDLRPEDMEKEKGNRNLDVRIMYASGEEEGIRSRRDAARVLHEEDFRWLELQWWFHGWDLPAGGGRGGGDRPAGCFSTASGLQARRPEFDGPEVLAAAPRPALGFWLFPVEAFGEVPEEDEEPRGWLKSKWIWDLSSHWPELALADVC
ncbi:hypothetical protein CORC01_08235 [Colletotrichum orchidophilum]|uniref:Uncharacterized protein n=1 Tax=Colletotrichum orchidophilum TaxID=1209926 RepID=A0A1G4B5C1_9PEZI|nr:uncharacterized protein CORC01_08235 [Colletotrichum orchidophilum]OHE96472.1 hypothetical protein CORC01_08235 [Colletotrichum orchidophilum]